MVQITEYLGIALDTRGIGPNTKENMVQITEYSGMA